jgi:hypothetical protein
MKKNYYTLLTIIVTILLITIISFITFHITSKKPITNSLVLFWDIYCKKNLIDYLNNNDISYKILDYGISDGVILQVGSNYFILMEKHPQEYSNISILIDSISKLIKQLGNTSLIGISTAGSKKYKIGTVLQFNSAIIQNYHQYELNSNFVQSNKILYKTNKFINEPIDDTKGFVQPYKNQYASGEDEFVVYIISNNLNIPCLTLTGISDNNNFKEYENGGGVLAAKNTVDFLFTTFNFEN